MPRFEFYFSLTITVVFILTTLVASSSPSFAQTENTRNTTAETPTSTETQVPDTRQPSITTDQIEIRQLQIEQEGTKTRKAIIESNQTDRKARIEKLKEERTRQYRVIRAQRQQDIELKPEGSQISLEEGQIQALTRFKNQASLNAARQAKIAEKMYTVLEKIRLHLSEQERGGFSVDDKLAMLDNLESQLGEVESLIDGFSKSYQDVELLTAEDIREVVGQTQTSSAQIYKELEDFRSEVLLVITKVQ